MISDDTSASGGDSSSGYSRGENQKPVTQSYKENWNLIFGKKPAAKKKAAKKPVKKVAKKAVKKTAAKTTKKTAKKTAKKKTTAKARKKR